MSAKDKFIYVIYGGSLASTIWLAGCISPDTSQPPPVSSGVQEPPTPFKRLPPVSTGENSDLQNPSGTVGVRQTLELALAQHPLLNSASWNQRAFRARVEQARLFPNPEFETELENFAGSGGARGFDVAEVTFWLGQPILLGGKRMRAIEVARAETELARWDYEAVRLAVMTAAVAAFGETLAAQENLKLARGAYQLAQRVHGTVTSQVEAGQVSPIEQTRTHVALARSRVELDRAGSRLKTARGQLAATWGASMPLFDRVEGDLRGLRAVPAFGQVEALLDHNPGVARWTSEVAQRQARLRLEKSLALPDLTLKGGVRRLAETGDRTFVAAMSLPLPILNRNQGNIRAARAQLKKARADQRAARLRAHRFLVTAFRALEAAYSGARTLLNEAVPNAEKAFQATEEAYREGKFDLIDVLDTQRTLTATRIQLNDALAAYHRGRAEVEGLIGQPLPRPQ